MSPKTYKQFIVHTLDNQVGVANLFVTSLLENSESHGRTIQFLLFTSCRLFCHGCIFIAIIFLSIHSISRTALVAILSTLIASLGDALRAEALKSGSWGFLSGSVGMQRGSGKQI
ncbi:hypothetical protein MA16_Dca025233 [Dendrobium catenatum]|uniref:Uncharacterized protein n=1 Tax=Dendrobium catenatum TaxID=906689 RepID=A0A2I0VEY7_9ASPA|nr:hypothetical protein MA16_Dca025233 [Dendrobium catenatum]